jgi:tetratricopeptide (TPR) repeat protein
MRGHKRQDWKPNRWQDKRADLAREKPRRWWLIGLVMVLAGGLLAVLVLGLQSRQTAARTNEVIKTDTPVSNSVPAGPPQAVAGEQVPPEVAPVPEDPVELVNIGNDLLSRGLPARAIPFFTKAMKINPEDEEIHFSLAFACAKAGFTNQALEHYQESLRIYPDYVEAHINLGNLYVNQREYGKAMDHFSAALAIMPDHSSALNNLAKCLAVQGRTEEAVEKLSQALRLNPDYMEARYNLGLAYTSLERFDEAIAEFSAVLRQEPQFRMAEAALARARALKAGRAGPRKP